jgi:hypothetical protein
MPGMPPVVFRAKGHPLAVGLPRPALARSYGNCAMTLRPSSPSWRTCIYGACWAAARSRDFPFHEPPAILRVGKRPVRGFCSGPAVSRSGSQRLGFPGGDEADVSDLQRPSAIDLRVGYDAAKGIVWFSELGEDGGAGFGASEANTEPPDAKTEPPDAEELVGVAYWLEDQFFHQARGPWGEPGRSAQATFTQWLRSRSTGTRGGLVPSTSALWCASAHFAADPSPAGNTRSRRWGEGKGLSRRRF